MPAGTHWRVPRGGSWRRARGPRTQGEPLLARHRPRASRPAPPPARPSLAPRSGVPWGREAPASPLGARAQMLAAGWADGPRRRRAALPPSRAGLWEERAPARSSRPEPARAARGQSRGASEAAALLPRFQPLPSLPASPSASRERRTAASRGGRPSFVCARGPGASLGRPSCAA